MKIILFSTLKMCIGIGMFGSATLLNTVYAMEKPPSLMQAPMDSAPTIINCPVDLTHLQAKMQEVLQFVKSPLIRDTLLASLQASIPEAIAQMDGVAEQIAFLKLEIARQERERVHAEEVARESLDKPSEPLLPCSNKMEGSYCYAVDQYYASVAANLANRAFLDALECYRREGVP